PTTPQPSQTYTLSLHDALPICEFNYNRFREPERTSKADLRRFVIGFGHRFDDRLSFVSEVEIEHAVASAGGQGEGEIEQAYLNRSEEHTSELQSPDQLVCRLLL